MFAGLEGMVSPILPRLFEKTTDTMSILPAQFFRIMFGFLPILSHTNTSPLKIPPPRRDPIVWQSLFPLLRNEKKFLPLFVSKSKDGMGLSCLPLFRVAL